MTWALIFFSIGPHSYGQSIAVVPNMTKEACMLAGGRAQIELKGLQQTSFICVQQTLKAGDK